MKLLYPLERTMRLDLHEVKHICGKGGLQLTG